jgi:hypothetical protein
MLVRERDRGVAPHEIESKLLASIGTRNGRKGGPDMFKPSKESLSGSFPFLVSSQICFASGGRGVGRDEMACGLISNMIANKIGGVVCIIKVPQRAVSLNLTIGGPRDVVRVGLEIAP